MLTASRTAALACLAIPSIVLAQPGEPAASPVTWDNIDRVIEGAEREGFSGAVLLVRGGEVVLNEGYGLADRAHNTPNSADTIFALGSTPIDFTRVAAIQLIDAGKLDPDDPVTKFFDDIPADKQSITVRHVLDSATGLPDFPNIRGVDADPDHSPLSRDQFIQRFRDAKLLFAPGEGEEHSHFAWGVLAAIVEVASGQSYEDYVREHILGPAGMSRTGFNGDEFPGETVAVGYGPRTFGEINSPPFWGPTSWLVQGSGGMVGTTGDLYQFNRAINDGTLLPEAAKHLYPSRGVFANGDEFGFETFYTFGFDNLFYLNCNSSNPRGRGGYDVRPLAQSLIQLTTGMRPPRAGDD